MLVYVDDIVIAGSSSSAVDHVVHTLSATFPIKDLGRLEYFLGIEAAYKSQGMILTQWTFFIAQIWRTVELSPRLCLQQTSFLVMMAILLAMMMFFGTGV
jgi:hypothetical protein